MPQNIHTHDAPAAIGAYSQGIRCGNTVYFSGQIPLDPKTMTLVSDDFRAQTEQVFNNLATLCGAVGGSLQNIVKLTLYLTDLSHFAIVNEVMMTFFQEPYPARTTIEVSGLPKQAQIECDAIMVLAD